MGPAVEARLRPPLGVPEALGLLGVLGIATAARARFLTLALLLGVPGAVKEAPPGLLSVPGDVGEPTPELEAWADEPAVLLPKPYLRLIWPNRTWSRTSQHV